MVLSRVLIYRILILPYCVLMGPIMPVFCPMVKGFMLKGVFQVENPGIFRVSTLGSVNFNHVKPGLEAGGMPGQIQLRRGAQPLLLAPVHKGGRRAVGGGFPQLDLHKAEVNPVLDNQVDLPKAAFPVDVCDPKALAAQIPRRLFLAPPASQPALLAAPRFFKKVRRWMGLGPCSRRSW